MRPFRIVTLRPPPDFAGVAPLLTQLESDLRLNFAFPQRFTETYTFAGVANGASAETELQLGKSFLLHSVSASHAVRLSVYGTEAGRTADTARAFGAAVPAAVPLVYDAEFDPSASEGTRYPFVYGANLETAPSAAIPVRLTNNSGGSADVTITLVVSSLEP